MLIQRRREQFFDQYVQPLSREARKLGIEPDELADMIRQGEHALQGGAQ